jgi:hypothetical protein
MPAVCSSSDRDGTFCRLVNRISTAESLPAPAQKGETLTHAVQIEPFRQAGHGRVSETNLI